MGFSELLAQSCFSFLRGASQPEELVAQAKGLGLSSLGLVDQGGLYGCVRAWEEAKKQGLKLHLGAELQLAPHGVRVPREPLDGMDFGLSVETEGGPRLDAACEGSAVFLVQNHRGYENLCRIISLAHAGLVKGEHLLESHFLERHHDGLVVVLPVCVVTEFPSAAAWLKTLSTLFAGRGFVAAFKRLDGRDEQRLQQAKVWSALSQFPIIVSAKPLFHEPKRKPLADVVYCIKNGTTLDEAGSAIEGNAQAFLRSERQIQGLFKEHPEWVKNTCLAAKLLQFDLSELKYQFPCELEPGESANERLARLTWEGAGRRYPKGVPEKVSKQIRKELKLIAHLEVAPYFLCTWEIVEIARSLKILCQGRGSAANSAVCFVLGITAVDPARSSLLFERFLSAERNEPPDIDIDFEHERREEVIQEIYRRYGRDKAAMVSEVICYRGKSALREVGKSFGLSLEQVDHLTQAITHWDSASEIDDKRLREYGFDPEDSRVRQTLHWARRLAGFPRHLSIHVGGFVLSKTPLYEVAPIEPAAMEGRTVVPWDKDDIDALGFFKVDVLGLGMLTAVRKALELIHRDGALSAQQSLLPGLPKRHQGEEFDPLEVVTRVPPEDPAVYAMVSEADTVGVFQIESRAQMAMLPRLRPQKFYDLVVEVALVRPGPIQGGMVHPYLRRRNKEEPVTVPHPDLWPILERTLGVPLFQEQVMQLAIAGAGYTGGQADQLRRDMAAWKKTGKLLRHKDRLLEGFSKKGISREFAEALFEQIKGFGEYGFPESHAASFALLVYLSSWQKVHYPAHFSCALLNSQPMGFYSPSSLVKDAQKHGVTVRPVDVCASDWDCTLELKEPPALKADKQMQDRMGWQTLKLSNSKALRLGLRQVKGFSQQSAEALVKARSKQPFSGLEDLKRRVLMPQDEQEALAEAGAFESLIQGRRQALWATRAPALEGLFGEVEHFEQPVRLPELQRAEQLVLDYQRVGLSIDDHPLSHLRHHLAKSRVSTAQQLQHLPDGGMVSVAGLVQSRQRPATASGIVFVTLEDETGTINVVVFAKVFEKYRLAARHASILKVNGKLERQVTEPRAGEVGRATAVIHVIAQHLERLDIPGRTVKARSRDFH